MTSREEYEAGLAATMKSLPELLNEEVNYWHSEYLKAHALAMKRKRLAMRSVPCAAIGWIVAVAIWFWR